VPLAPAPLAPMFAPMLVPLFAPLSASLLAPLFALLLWPAGAIPDPLSSPAVSPTTPDRDHYVWVASEAVDQVALVRWGPGGAEVVRIVDVSMIPTDADGPHGVAVSPDGAHLYVTTAHGHPYGYLWKIDAETGQRLGRVSLGLFPASLDVSPDGALAWVVNFNLHGDMVPSSVSVVSTRDLVEVARIETCTMPHGSRITTDGRRQYSTCMMDDLLVEANAWGLELSRHFLLTPGRAHGMSGPPQGGHGGMGDGGMGHDAHAGARCSPTWAQPTPDGRSIYVACNASDELLEIDAESWTLARRIPAGRGIYNVAITSDGGRLVATNKQSQSISVFDLESGEELARIPTLRKTVHGVVISPDDRWAFVTVEGIGSEPGTLEIVDLSALSVSARVDLGQMAGGIVYWKE
jgi:DNA-binding beta-propeller fold protein YncE